MKYELTHLLAFAKQAALKAGEILKEGFGRPQKISQKEGKLNWATEYDLASQECIIEILRKEFPMHNFLAEEGKTKIKQNQEITWIIDPLDGTVNFTRSIPHFAISIAAALNTEILVGVVYNPIVNELFDAKKGNGAFFNETPLKVSKTKNLDVSLAATGFPYNLEENPLHCIERMEQMLRMGLHIRRIGAASLDLAYTAAGRFDAYWEVGLHPWDMAAGKLLVEEAGGKVSHYDGKEHQLFGYFNLIATNGLLHQKMVNLLKGDLKK